MQIVVITPEYPPSDRMGGIGTHSAALAPALARRGHEVCVVTRGTPQIAPPPPARRTDCWPIESVGLSAAFGEG